MNFTFTKYQFLNNFREPTNIFWTMVYPLLMALMFFTAFQGFLNPKPMNIPVAVEQSSPALVAFQAIDIVNVTPMTAPEAQTLLAKDQLVGFIDNQFDVTVGKSGVEETVLVNLASQMKQMEVLNVPYENYDFSANYITTMNTRTNPFLIPFYSLIGMVSLYSIYMGLEYARSMQANQSTVAQRMNVVPLKKSKFLASSLVVGIATNLASNLVLLAFMKLVLKLDVVTDYPRTMAILLSANLVGISLGLFIGASNNASDGLKTGIVISSTLVMAFLSGMMSTDIKILVEANAPLVGLLNPVNIVTTELYRINYLDTTTTFSRGVMLLLGMAALFLVLSQLFLRRKTYESI